MMMPTNVEYKHKLKDDSETKFHQPLLKCVIFSKLLSLFCLNNITLKVCMRMVCNIFGGIFVKNKKPKPEKVW